MTSRQRTAPPPALVAVTSLMLIAMLGVGTAVADFSFTFEVEKAIHIGHVGPDFTKVHCVITNTGTSNDTYDICRQNTDLPAGWTTSICVGGEDGFCYADFLDCIPDPFAINAGESDTVSLYFTPLTGEGSGYATLQVQSTGNPALQQELVAGIVTDGCNPLLVDDDGGETLETYYQDAVPPGMFAGTWHYDLALLDDTDLQNFPAAVWFTGLTAEGYDLYDRLLLQHYLEGGGRLFASGQDLAWAMCDPASPAWSAESQAWYEDWLRGVYVQDDAGTTSLDPVAGDPIAQGMALAIAGGDGASNQTDPDVLAPGVAAASSWDYSGGGGSAAVRGNGVLYRVVTFGFGFEAISTANDRLQVMFHVLDWLDDPLIGVNDQGAAAVPGTLVLEQPQPNPFNPDVTIPYAVQAAGPVTLRIVDGSGRLVRTLLDGVVEAGTHHERWDGRDNQGRRLASGVYFVELRGREALQTRKVVLAK